jgi:hypothetical protein
VTSTRLSAIPVGGHNGVSGRIGVNLWSTFCPPSFNNSQIVISRHFPGSPARGSSMTRAGTGEARFATFSANLSPVSYFLELAIIAASYFGLTEVALLLPAFQCSRDSYTAIEFGRRFSWDPFRSCHFFRSDDNQFAFGIGFHCDRPWFARQPKECSDDRARFLRRASSRLSNFDAACRPPPLQNRRRRSSTAVHGGGKRRAGTSLSSTPLRLCE